MIIRSLRSLQSLLGYLQSEKILLKSKYSCMIDLNSILRNKQKVSYFNIKSILTDIEIWNCTKKETHRDSCSLFVHYRRKNLVKDTRGNFAEMPEIPMFWEVSKTSKKRGGIFNSRTGHHNFRLWNGVDTLFQSFLFSEKLLLGLTWDLRCLHAP